VSSEAIFGTETAADLCAAQYVVRQFEDKLFELSLQEAEAGEDAAGVGLDVVGDEGQF
jgi:hypothetical protein